jgi:RNA polymerase sigma factor (sigma-70 family)
MAARQLNADVRRLCTLVASEAVRNLTDGELLRRFSAHHDEAAFAVLMRRHGPMVFNVCRQVLGHEQDAEDAFQATFLVLAQKAASIRKRGAVASWLHGVAYRSAMQVRRAVARRRTRERPAKELPQRPPPCEVAWRELQAVLDAELQRLPEKYRSPFVLCCLEGLSRAEAAQQLGWKDGTVAGRLAEARKLLQQRLSRRGVTFSAVLWGVSLSSGGAPAAVPAGLSQATVRAAVSLTVGQAAIREVASAPVVLAVQGATRTLALTRIKLAALLLCVLSLVAGAGAVVYRALVASQPEQNQAAAPPAQGGERSGAAEARQAPADPLPVGAVARLGTRRLCGRMDPMWVGFSPDGMKLASRGMFGITTWDATTGRQLVERASHLGEGAIYDVTANALGWRADGTGVAIVRLQDGSFFVSAFTDPNEKLPTPPAVRRGATPIPDVPYLALSPDATRLAVVRTPAGEKFTIDLLPATPGCRVTELKPERTLGPLPGPCREIRYTAGGRLVFLSGPWEEKGDWSVAFVDPDNNIVSQTIRIPPPAFCVWQYMLSFSADGRLAAIPTRAKLSTNTHEGTMRVWDLVAGKELWKLPFPQCGYGTGHAFTPDRKRLITSTDKIYFQVWDLATGKETIRCPAPGGEFHSQEASAVAFSPDGKRFATARRDGRVDIWDTATGKAVLPLSTHRDVIEAVAVSPDARLAATLGYDASIRVWELKTGNPRCLFPAPRGKDPTGRHWTKHRLAFTPDGRGLLFAAAGELEMADPTTGKPLDLPGGLRNRKGYVGRFAADGRTLATFAGDGVTLWDWPAGTARVTVTVPASPVKEPSLKGSPEVTAVNSIALSPDGRFLFTNSARAAKDNLAGGWFQNANDVWDARTGKHLHRLTAPKTEYPPGAFAPDSRVMYLGGHSLDFPEQGRKVTDALTAWDPATGTLICRFADSNPGRTSRGDPRLDSMRSVDAVAVSPDARLLAAAEGALSSDRSVCLYETASGKVIKKLAGHSRWVTDLAFSPDGRRLVSVSEDQTGLVWDVTLPTLGGVGSGKPAGAGLADAWDRLAAPDGALGYSGMAALAAAPAEAVPLLRARLRPAAVPTEADLDRLVGQLDANAFADREQASVALERFGPNAVAGAKARLARTPSLEVRNRLTRFLDKYDGPNPSPYHLRCTRGVAVLEAIGTTDARALLAELAKGPADDFLTREAEAMGRRGGSR